MKLSVCTKLAPVLALCVLLAVPAHGQSSPKPTNQELTAITARGTLLAAYDQAAWHATDAVQATPPVEGKIQRYIAHKSPTGWTVDFGHLNADSTKFLVAYEAVQIDTPTHFGVTTFDPERQDTDFNLTAARAIDLAVKGFTGAANYTYNLAVLPADTEGLFVYLYPAQVKDGVYPYGGDARFLISPDGGTILVKRQLHKSVLESVPAQIPKSTTTVAGYHTHVLSNLPEDTDVFLVLSRQPRIPEYVGAGGRVFVVNTDGTIKIAK